MVKNLLHHTQWPFVCNFMNVHVEEEDGKVEEEERLVCLCVSSSRAKQSLGYSHNLVVAAAEVPNYLKITVPQTFNDLYTIFQLKIINCSHTALLIFSLSLTHTRTHLQIVLI